MMEYFAEFPEELPLNHEPSLDHWARVRATEYIENSEGSFDWDYEYDLAWESLDAEFNYTYEYREVAS